MGINEEQVEGHIVGALREPFGKFSGNKTEESKGNVNQSAGAPDPKIYDV